MDTNLSQLLALYARERAAARPMVLAVVLETQGSTYGKQGSLLVIAANGDYAGLISGGCLEGDLREHARAVQGDGRPRRVSYDMRGPDDLLFGIGSGCEGAMQVWLQRVVAENDWQPLAAIAAARAGAQELRLSLDVSAAGEIGAPGAAGATFELHVPAPFQLLILGAGRDAEPVCRLASEVDWSVTVADHRPALADAARFPKAAAVHHLPARELSTRLALERYDAALIMSHHLETDQHYLQALAHSKVPYVGLLGPPPRRERLLSALSAAARASLHTRLRAPVGLALGGRAPESIALAIVAEIHAWRFGAAVLRA